jgi:predicted esterase
MTLTRSLPLLFLLACEQEKTIEEDWTDLGDDTAATDGTDGGEDGGDDGGGEVSPAEDLPNGSYLLGFSVSAVGGLVIPFQAEVEAVVDGAGNRSLASFSLRATDGEAVSDVLTTATDVPVNADGSFAITLPNFELPAAYSPTSSAVEVAAVLTGSATGPDFFCGELSGQIVTFELDLAGSTFGAIPWEDRAMGAPDSCDTTGGETLPRIEAADCPTLTDGVNTGFPSGGASRNFEVVLPSDYSADRSWPIVFLWHGIGGAAGDMLDAPGQARAYADSAGMILVSSQAMESGGVVLWDVFTGEDTNMDLVLFDDILTCAGTSWNLDSSRIYTAGMSNGGLFTGLLIAQRSAVLAAAAPFSGGISADFPDDATPIPVEVLWGGVDDTAYEQNFNTWALEMMEMLQANGSFVAACDHGMGHELDASFWPFTFQFFADHPQGLSPEPYATALPEVYPDYCYLPG